MGAGCFILSVIYVHIDVYTVSACHILWCVALQTVAQEGETRTNLPAARWQSLSEGTGPRPARPLLLSCSCLQMLLALLLFFPVIPEFSPVAKEEVAEMVAEPERANPSFSFSG